MPHKIRENPYGPAYGLRTRTPGPVWHAGQAPSARDQQIVDILDDWVGRDAPRLDANGDTFFDEPGPVIMDAVWRPIADAVMAPVFGNLVSDLDTVRDLDAGAGTSPGLSYVDKDLRKLRGDPVVGPFNLSYCGLGSLADCSASLGQAIHQTADTVAAQQGKSDPSLWRKAATVTRFVPGVLSNTFPSTNRSTFQEVLEFDRSGSWGSGSRV